MSPARTTTSASVSGVANAPRLRCRSERTFNFMKRKFKVGDHVRWNSEAGHVSGRIIKVHTSDSDYKGYTHHASKDDPQYEIRSHKTTHVAMHKGSALHQID